MPTIGKRWRWGNREGAGICDVCGVRYPMSRLARNGDGMWACTGSGTNNDLRGRTRAELAALEADAAYDMTLGDTDRDMGAFDSGDS